MSEQELKIFYSLLSSKIIEVRKQLKLTQQAFADELHISRASIVNIEKKRQKPTIHLLFKISILGNVDMNYFFKSIPKDFMEENRFSKKIDKRISEEEDNIMIKNFISSKLLS
jgi:transcriptional regulator with XRE-family HTH domain